MDMPALDERLKEARTELFNLRFQAATGQLENHRQIRHVRRQIAQILTVIHGRRLGFEEVTLIGEAPSATTRRRAAGPKAGAETPAGEAAPVPAGPTSDEIGEDEE